MAQLELFIGTRAWSSWSLRPWLALKATGAPFKETLIELRTPQSKAEFLKHSPAGKVPILKVDGFAIWDSLAICEYLAEAFPAAKLWPADPIARARARSVSAEMHAGFTALRTAMPMNLKLRLKGKPASPEVQRDIDRVVEIWEEARTWFATGDGPWLFGDFSVADAMFAPVACRFDIYNVPLPSVAAAYRDAILAHPALLEWRAAGLLESEAHAHYDRLADEYGGPR